VGRPPEAQVVGQKANILKKGKRAPRRRRKVALQRGIKKNQPNPAKKQSCKCVREHHVGTSKQKKNHRGTKPGGLKRGEKKRREKRSNEARRTKKGKQARNQWEKRKGLSAFSEAKRKDGGGARSAKNIEKSRPRRHDNREKKTRKEVEQIMVEKRKNEEGKSKRKEGSGRQACSKAKTFAPSRCSSHI